MAPMPAVLQGTPPDDIEFAGEREKGRRMSVAGLAVGIVMGSQSDWETMQHVAATLDRLGIGYEARIVSAHRTPERLYEYARTAGARGLRVIVAGAGGAAHLPGMVAALTPLPVLGVPIETRALKGMDSLLSIVQMPAGIPVATFAIGRAGAVNAALFAAAMLGLADPAAAAAVDGWRQAQTEAVRERPDGS
jgi:5-(carboxyamino)imidazole ribonucleotide mutase